MRPLLLTLFLSSMASAQTSATPQALSAFLGHWEGSGTFTASPMSSPGTVSSKTDCVWSPQGHYLICEQTITDDKGTHQQLTAYTSSEDAGAFSYYTIAGSVSPFSGKVKIDGNVWTYDNSFDQDGKKTEVRTVNTFSGDVESFKTEFSVNGGPWTTMLEGKSHRVPK